MIQYHGILIHNEDLIFQLNLFEEAENLRERIVDLCELLYIENKDSDKKVLNYVPMMISYLIAKSLDGAKKDIKRVYLIRQCLSVLDFQEENFLTNILLRCVISPQYLSSDDGMKFLVFLFTMNSTLADLVHSAVIPQVFIFFIHKIYSSTEEVLDRYGELYYKTWKNSKLLKYKIETDIIQDLMFHAIHSRENKLLNSIRVILNKFVQNKKVEGVDKMLHGLFYLI
jgi:condensin-2 complex subunit G2